jgi:hypothetical protein
MNARRVVRVWFVAAAAMAVLSTGPLYAGDLEGGGETEDSLKQKACKAAGCGGGGQECADITGTISVPGVGSLEVTWHCYQRWGGDEELLN